LQGLQGPAPTQGNSTSGGIRKTVKVLEEEYIEVGIILDE
jgi:hypothetical protein